MSQLFVAIDLGEEAGRVMLGTLHKGSLRLSDILQFDNVPAREKDAVLWDVASLYQATITGLREVGAYLEPIDGISCTGWDADYLLFHADASFIEPTFSYASGRTLAGRKEVLRRLSLEEIYEETGVADSNKSTLFQLGVENARQLKRADHLMPVADGFNFLLSGAPCVEWSSASATQLFNPTSKQWSQHLLHTLNLPAKVFPAVVDPGTCLKPLRPEIAEATGLEGAQIIATCSNNLAAALASLPVSEAENWAFIKLGRNATIGAAVPEPIIGAASREANLSHLLGADGAIYAHTQTVGLSVLEECRQYWAATDHSIDDASLAHLAATAQPLVSLVNLADPHFAGPGDIITKVQNYCRDTRQISPRRPGAIYRCLMESLAFLYRRTLDDIARATGREFTRVFLIGDSKDNILHHFIANALQMPLTTAPAHAAALGNVLLQARTLNCIESRQEAEAIVQGSFKFGTINPHPEKTWAPVYQRYQRVTAVQLAEAMA
ncbi:MAG: rhamnulokinase [Verrucomicrobiota bacterium]|jgi:rhamnulokinase